MQDLVFGKTLMVSGPASMSLLVERKVAQRIQLAKEQIETAQINRAQAETISGHQLAELTGASLLAVDSITVIEEIAGLNAELHASLLEIAANPGPNLTLVLTHTAGVKGKGMIDKLKKIATENETVTEIKPWQIPDFVVEEGKRQKVTVSVSAAGALVDALGTDLRSLAGAISQLAADSETKKIDEELIAQYFAGRAEITSFSIADAVMAGNKSLALERLRWAIDIGVAPVLVTSALGVSLRSMGKYLDLRRQRVDDREISRLLSLWPKKLKEMATNARKWSSAGVAKSILDVTKGDGAIKGASANPEYALEHMVVSILNNQAR